MERQARGRTVALAVILAALAASCGRGLDGRPLAGPTPSPSSPASPSKQKEKLCQPFPDRLIDGFLAAYEDRDVGALTDLVRVTSIHDTTAVAHAGRADFADVEDWARAGWEAEDRLDLIGYGAFAGTNDGFTMYLVRENEGLRGAGIEELAMLLHARSTGCLIDELGSVGPIQARGAPCRFYHRFGDHEAVVADQPPQCADGSGDFARMGHAVVWAGREMIIVGGTRAGEFRTPDLWETGLRHTPATGWDPTSTMPPSVRGLKGAAWTGQQVLVWGGFNETGAATYDPSSDDWKKLPPWPLEDPEDPPGVWTGDQLVVWGSSSHTDDPQREGAVYDPSSNAWTTTAEAPIAGRSGHTAVWTGRELIVWGGSNFRTDLDDGAAYDPITDTWRRIAPGPLSGRQEHTALWTGREMIVFGGSSFSSTRADGAAFDPVTDTWRRIERFPLEGRNWHAAVWTGDDLVVWGGHSYRTNEPLGDGASYDPVRDRWTVLPEAPIEPRCHHSAVWTGRQVVIYGGYDACGSGGHIPFGDGAAYDPDTRTWERLNPAG